MSFSPTLRVRKAKVAVNESIEVYLGGEFSGARIDLLNVYLEPQWPVGLFIAVYDREYKYLGRFVPPSRQPDILPPSEAWHLPGWLKKAGARFVIQRQDWIGDAVLTKPGVYRLQAIATLRMVGKRPGEMDDEYGRISRGRWFHPLCDQEMCRSPVVEVEVVDSSPAAAESEESVMVFSDASDVPFVSRISLPKGTRVTVGKMLKLNVFLGNPSKKTAYLYDPLCRSGAWTNFCRADLILTTSSSAVSQDLFDERFGGSNSHLWPPLRLPSNGWCEAQIVATYHWKEERECALQLRYHKDVFLSEKAYEMSVNSEDHSLLMQSHLDVNAPRHQIISNKLVVKPGY
jgi:hypothetical protein